MIATEDSYVRSTALMGTTVTIEIVGRADADRLADRALTWFHAAEATCSRFDRESEVTHLLTRVGEAVRVSPLLLGAVHFAISLAEETGGAFDPTVGHLLESRGDNVHYLTGIGVRTNIHEAEPVSWRDIEVNRDAGTITIAKPLLLDLGAVAKGLAIDLAVQELAAARNFAIDAGGDLYLGGRNAHREPWSVGIRHPREKQHILETLTMSDAAVCTSGDYERRFGGNGHIVDARTRGSASASISATVVSPSAMVADALSTAAFILGGQEGVALLARHGVDGMIVSESMERYATRGMARRSTPVPR